MKHKDIIEKMTLEEKAAFLSGKGEWETRDIERLGIPSIFCSDGPHGLRKQAGEGDHLGLNASLPATCFPTAATVANSWDEALGEEIGRALGEEASCQNVHVLLGPGLNIKRSPLCGRNFEYFSEDPYLAGKMAAAYVRGIQSQGVCSCPKHFAVNSQELRRMAMDSVLDERTLREIYLTGFEIAVKEGKAGAIMSSYNEVNGVYANENKHLLRDILRGEWGFDGIVITDWGASNDHAKGVAAGSNLEMPAPGLDSARELIAAIQDGRLAMEELDDCVDGLLDAVLALTRGGTAKSASEGQDGSPTKSPTKSTDKGGAAKSPATGAQGKAEGSTAEGGFDEEAHHALARRAAIESAVLLKNEDGILPLPKGAKVAVIGDFAMEPRYQGAGSSVVNPTRLESVQGAIGGYDLEVIGVARGYRRDGAESEELLREAVGIAARADIVLYFFGLDEISESEGLDRKHMRIPANQASLLEALAKANGKVVGILSAGSSVEMPWESRCKAILHGYLNGQAGGSAILDLLTGRACPSGRLNETYPLRYEDTPAIRHFPSKERTAEYREGIYVGYRYYDANGIPVRYPFGFGLSYTTFEYGDLHADQDKVTFTLKNTGECDGAEVAQLYIGLPGAKVFRPKKELKGFRKVFLRRGESKEVTIPLDDKAFRYWNVRTGAFETEGGTYQIMVGASAADIRLTASLPVKGTTQDLPYEKTLLPSYFSGAVQQVGDKEFEALLGRPIPDGRWSGQLGRNDAICQMSYAKSAVARFLCKRLAAMKEKSERKGKPDLNILFIYNMPFRGIAKMTGGAVSMAMVDGMVMAANGHLFRGLGKVIGGFFSNAKANKEYEAKLAQKEK